jgi:cobalt-zinc-cadmium efflux system membrane fusion protein
MALAWFGVSVARPHWLPTWARLDTKRLPAWMLVGEHGGQEADKDEADRETPPVETDTRASWQVVRLASAKLAQRFGIETAAVTRERHAHRLTCNAETAYDARHSAEVLSRVSGVLREVRVDLGQVVRQGDLIAVVDSAQVGTAKVQLHTARSTVELAQVTYDRTRRLTQEKAAPAKTEMEHLTALNQAKANLMDAEQKLRNLGFSDAEITRIARANDASNQLDILAPIGGTITAWDATPGEAVEPTTQLFAMSDTTRMWLWIDVFESDIVAVAVGQPVAFTISGTEAPVFTGRVTAMGTEVNPTTRTTRVRAELDNPDGRLRANQFGRAKIQVEPEHEAIVVPRAAVQSDGAVEFVFLPEGEAAFRPRKVVTRPIDQDGVVEVTSGLESGERVVTTRSFMLKAELFKNRLGAADND